MLTMVILVTIRGIATVAICTDIEWHRQSTVPVRAQHATSRAPLTTHQHHCGLHRYREFRHDYF
jgi:hypothetical protein